MIYVNFKSVKYENFASYIDPFEFKFENGKIILITGPNGVGKSTIFNAVSYALYGQTPTGKTSDDVINNKTNKNCLVECIFHYDSDVYKVIRTVKYKKLGSTALVYKNNSKKPIAKGYREVTKFIENLLVTKELFFNTIFFGQNVKTFFTDLPDSKQKSIFRQILQLNNYVVYQKNASKLIDQYKLAIADLQKNIDILQSNINLIQDNIEKYNNDIHSKSITYTNLEYDTNSILSQINELQDKLNELKESEVQLELANLNDKYTSFENQLQNLKSLTESKKNELDNMKELQISKNKETFLINEKAIIKSKTDGIKALTVVFNENVDILKSKLDDLRIKYLEEKSKLDNQFNANKEERNQIYNDKIQQNLDKINEIISIINKLNIEQSEISTIIEYSSNKIKEYKSAIENRQSICPTCFQKWDDISHIDKLIEDESKIVIEKTEILNNILRQIQDNKNEQEKLTNENSELKQKLLLELDMIEKQYNTTKIELDEKFKNKADVIKSEIKKLEIKFNKDTDEIENKFNEDIKKINNDLICTNNKIEEKFKQKINDILLDYEKKYAEYKKQMTVCNAEISELKQKLSQIESLKNQIKQLEQRKYENDIYMKDIIKYKNEMMENIKINKEKISEYQNNIREHNNKINEVKNNIKMCLFWKQGFSSSGIPSMLIDESIPFMNKRIQYYLEKMSNGRYHVTFDTLKELNTGEFRDKISIHVYDSVTHSNSRKQFSGGQIKLVDIATILTLSDLQEDIHKFRINICLFDEIFDALDDQNIINVTALLRSILTKDKSICLITHRFIDQIDADDIYQLNTN